MTTTLNPSGTPTVVYNKGGKTIETISAGATSPGTQIAKYAQHTVVLVDPNGGTLMDPTFAQMPTADVGDFVELFMLYSEANGSSRTRMLPGNGCSFANSGTFTSFDLEFYASFLKISETIWQLVHNR